MFTPLNRQTLRRWTNLLLDPLLRMPAGVDLLANPRSSLMQMADMIIRAGQGQMAVVANDAQGQPFTININQAAATTEAWLEDFIRWRLTRLLCIPRVHGVKGPEIPQTIIDMLMFSVVRPMGLHTEIAQTCCRYQANMPVVRGKREITHRQDVDAHLKRIDYHLTSAFRAILLTHKYMKGLDRNAKRARH